MRINHHAERRRRRLMVQLAQIYTDGQGRAAAFQRTRRRRDELEVLEDVERRFRRSSSMFARFGLQIDSEHARNVGRTGEKDIGQTGQLTNAVEIRSGASFP